jgi:hypothetical protein
MFAIIDIETCGSDKSSFSKSTTKSISLSFVNVSLRTEPNTKSLLTLCFAHRFLIFSIFNSTRFNTLKIEDFQFISRGYCA